MTRSKPRVVPKPPVEAQPLARSLAGDQLVGQVMSPLPLQMTLPPNTASPVRALTTPTPPKSPGDW